MTRVLLLFGLCLCAASAGPAAHAQLRLIDSRLPTPFAGDYLNGVAASDVTGGLFVAGRRARPAPAVAFGIPTAFGADWRDVFAAAGGHVGHSRGEWFEDGAVFLGAGGGDARRLLAIEATLAIYDLVGDTFAERTLSVKLHRRWASHWAVAVGVENLLIAGHTDGGRSAYGVVSGILPLRAADRPFNRLTLTAGVGDGRFNAYENVRQGRNAAGTFLGIALRVVPAASGFVSWTGQDLNAGISFVPFPNLPFVVTPVFLNVDGAGGHGARFAASVGVGWTLYTNSD